MDCEEHVDDPLSTVADRHYPLNLSLDMHAVSSIGAGTEGVREAEQVARKVSNPSPCDISNLLCTEPSSSNTSCSEIRKLLSWLNEHVDDMEKTGLLSS